MNAKLAFVFLVSAIALQGCATMDVRMVGEARSPTDEYAVFIYQDPSKNSRGLPLDLPVPYEITPAEYEPIAVLNSNSIAKGCSGGFSIESQKKQVINALAKQAAALGANGIVMRELEVILCSPPRIRREYNEETQEMETIREEATYRVAGSAEAIYTEEYDSAYSISAG